MRVEVVDRVSGMLTDRAQHQFRVPLGVLHHFAGACVLPEVPGALEPTAWVRLIREPTSPFRADLNVPAERERDNEQQREPGDQRIPERVRAADAVLEE